MIAHAQYVRSRPPIVAISLLDFEIWIIYAKLLFHWGKVGRDIHHRRTLPMIHQTIAKALEELRAERDRLDEARSRIDQAISALEGAGATATPRRRGRPPKSAKAAKAGARTARSTGRARRGLLRETLHKILGDANAPLTAATIRDKVAATGYPHSTRQNLYVNVYQALGNDKGVRKTAAGYSLNGRAAASGRTATKTTAKKKKATAKKAKRKAAK